MCFKLFVDTAQGYPWRIQGLDLKIVKIQPVSKVKP